MLEILLIIIIILLSILFLGIKISLTYKKKDNIFRGQLKIIILKKIKIYTYSFPSQEKSDDKKEDENNPNYKKLFKLIKPCLKDLIYYLKIIFKSSQIKKVQNHLIFGLDDFADTGKYIGIIWGILAIINQLDENLKISAEPSFNGYKLEGYGENNLEIYPLKLIIPTTRLIFKKNIRELIKGIINERGN